MPESKARKGARPHRPRRRLSDVLAEAMEAFCAEESQRHPQLADEFATVTYAELLQYLEWEAHTPPAENGRIDTRKLQWRFYLRIGEGPRIALTQVWSHHLCDEHGRPIDTRADVRSLLQQQGQRIPDDLSSLPNP